VPVVVKCTVVAAADFMEAAEGTAADLIHLIH
jgi:hypothetical protein